MPSVAISLGKLNLAEVPVAFVEPLLVDPEGETAKVVSDRKKYDNTEVSIIHQSNNPWTNSDLLPEEELVLLKKKLEK